MWGHATAFARNHLLLGEVLAGTPIAYVVLEELRVHVVVSFLEVDCRFRNGM